MALNLIKPDDPQKDYLKWKLYCHTHSKSILELDPQLNAVVRKYSIKRLYELSLASPSIKPKVDDYLKMFLCKGQAEKIASEFNVDMYCIYEDFVELVEMIYKAAEEAYQDEIMKNNMKNYLEIIAIYRLIIDMTDLTVIWKEKDDNIKKFEMFCKYRVVNIMERKNKPLKKEQTSIDKELEKVAKEAELNKPEPRDDNNKDKYKTDEELIEEFTDAKRKKNELGMEVDKMKTDEELMEEFSNEKKLKKLMTFDDSNTYKYNKDVEKVMDLLKEDIRVNTLPNNKYKTEKELMDEYEKEEKGTAKEIKVEVKPSNTKIQPKDVSKVKAYAKQNNINEKGKPIPQNQQKKEQRVPINQQIKNPQIQSGADKPVVVITNNKKNCPPQSKAPNIFQKEKDKKVNDKNRVNSNQNKHNNSFTRKRVKETKDYYISVLESMMQETSDIPPMIVKEPIKSPLKEVIRKEQMIQPQKVDHKHQQIIDINAEFIDSEQNKMINPFDKISTPMLSTYKYPGNCKYTGQLPVKFKSDDYFDLINCIQTVLVPMIEKDIQNNKNGKALHESEMILYYLSNIIP